jgi:AcrR family transcriptional regulator
MYTLIVLDARGQGKQAGCDGHYMVNIRTLESQTVGNPVDQKPAGYPTVGSVAVASDISKSRAGRSDRSSRSRSRDTLSRDERKEVTRRAIVAAALHLLEQGSFTGLSLREVTREAGIVPAAFYRHFDSMESLGLVLIDESFRSLRDMLRGARAGKLDTNHVIDSSAEILIASISERREHWRFITRERSSGVASLRYAIRTEIRLLTSELAIDLARFPGLKNWSSEDLNILANLFVNAMISIAELVEDVTDPTALEVIEQTAIKQLSMIAVGVRGWRSNST